jgi:hypothetical protein
MWTRAGGTFVSTEHLFLTVGAGDVPVTMAMGVFNGMVQVDWTLITVTREHYAGAIHAIEVETHGLYLSNGLLS